MSLTFRFAIGHTTPHLSAQCCFLSLSGLPLSPSHLLLSIHAQRFWETAWHQALLIHQPLSASEQRNGEWPLLGRAGIHFNGSVGNTEVIRWVNTMNGEQRMWQSHPKAEHRWSHSQSKTLLSESRVQSMQTKPHFSHLIELDVIKQLRHIVLND